ncbi:MAG: threonine synthase [Elusimicrobia bacterium]|nr:threonine synthase [Elusimicrobiota bacterium]
MPGIIERYREFLPVGPKTPIVTLNEGSTPLVRADRVAALAGLPRASVYLKLEGSNPTGSFKDRGMTLAMTKALEGGARGVICASTGNTAASAAAYAARAGLPCHVFLPDGAVALGKLSQAVVYGARVITVKGNFDACFKLVREAAQEYSLTIVNSSNPYRLEGQKTAAFEIWEEFKRFPTHQFMPVGNAGNITAYWRGYKEFFKFNSVNSQLAIRNSQLPMMMGYQARGAAPIVLGKPVKNPQTIATAIRIGNPVSWQGALGASEESEGVIAAVSDAQILSAYRLLASKEGVFCEPSSAAGVAGFLTFARQGGFRKIQNPRIVCILTGHGLKDPDTPLKSKAIITTINADGRSLKKIFQR